VSDIKFLYMFIICLHTDYACPASVGHPLAKYRFRAAALLLFYIIQNKICTILDDITPYKTWGP